MNKDVKMGMLIGLGLVVVVVVAISIWPGGTVGQRHRQAEGNGTVVSPPTVTRPITPPQASNPVQTPLLVQQQMQRAAEHVIGQFEQARIDSGPLIHVVAEGETLTHIAQQHYGDVKKWQLIAEANKKVLPDVNLIRPGMRLVIPLPDKQP